MKRYTAKRTLIVPARRTFSDLHQILQRAFDWENYHLHEYVLHDDQEHRLYAAGAYDEELDDTDGTLGADGDFCLVDLLSDGSRFTYLYDFGDGWEVELRVASPLENYDKAHPTCTVFEGDAPPEDVGGVYGFLEFLDAVSNPEDPGHDRMLEWAGSRWRFRPNESKDINYSLVYC